MRARNFVVGFSIKMMIWHEWYRKVRRYLETSSEGAIFVHIDKSEQLEGNKVVQKGLF